ncbi:MAG: hypothetical protein R2831_08675 [Chitinophagaceae bacterium]
MYKLSSVIVILVAITSFVACRKYEEGPNISFRTKNARITNNWRIESALVQGVEKSLDPYYAKQKHYFYSNGDYVVTIIDAVTLEAENLQGNWTFFDNDKKVALTIRKPITQKDSTTEYHILKLYNKQLWLRKTDNTEELHFVPFE